MARGLHPDPGDPARETPWHELDRFLAQEFEHESGQRLRLDCTVVDFGGAHTEQVYRYARARFGRRVFAVKGGSITGRPLVERPSTHNRYQVKLFVLCVDTGKDTVLSRMRMGSPGQGYIHLPEWADEEYLAQLTAEKAIRKYVKGRGAVREWVKLRERNEGLDLEVYALAALYICGPAFIRGLGDRAAKFARRRESEPAPESKDLQRQPARLRSHPRRSGWVHEWRY